MRTCQKLLTVPCRRACYPKAMRYFLLLTLVLGLVACDPEDVVDVRIDPPQVVEDAVNGVQQGVDGLNDAVQNLGESAGGGEEGAEDGGESEDEGN